jgi:hypothetical protein
MSARQDGHTLVVRRARKCVPEPLPFASSLGNVTPRSIPFHGTPAKEQQDRNCGSNPGNATPKQGAYLGVRYHSRKETK